MGIQRRAIVYQYQTPIAAAAVQAWHSTPITIAPAPGVSRVIEPLRMQMQLKAGTVPFGVTDVDNLFFGWGTYLDATHATGVSRPFLAAGGGSVAQTTDRIMSGSTIPMSTLDSALPNGFVATDLTNKPLILIGDNDLLGGVIATKTLNAAGLLYAALDTGHIVQGSNTSATYRVDTIGGGGAVATFTITNPGTNYVAANGLSTDTSGAGSGFKVNITSITKGDGSLITTVFYGIVQLS